MNERVRDVDAAIMMPANVGHRRTLAAALEQELAGLSRNDPADTIRAVGSCARTLNSALAKAAGIRLRALRALRADGVSYDRIARRTGLSKSRVAQLAKTARDEQATQN